MSPQNTSDLNAWQAKCWVQRMRLLRNGTHSMANQAEIERLHDDAIAIVKKTFMF